GSTAEAKSAKAVASKTSSKTNARKRSGASASSPKSTAEASTAKVSAAKVSAAKATSKSAPSAEGAALRKVAELEALLTKANEQISALQEDVKTHQERVFELKDSLKTAESESSNKDIQVKMLASELNEAKKNVLKLTEANEKANEKASEAASKAAVEKAELAEEAAKKESTKPAERQSLSLQNAPRRGYYKSIPEYAIQRGTPLAGQNNSMMSDDDIGWVD
ncbi:MAG: hypothetical protein WBA76_13040, partial [Phormidesmis sp.]